jgi:hypothetical protein
MRYRLLLLLAVLALPACDVLGGSGEEIDFTMQFIEIQPFEGEPTLDTQVLAGRLVFNGRTYTECLQLSLGGNVVQVSRTQIDVRIVEQRGEPGCAGGRRYFDYNVFVGPLHPRRYLVNVTYREIDGTVRTLLSEHVDVS